MIATENVAILEGLFYIMLEHKERLHRWSDWPIEKQKAVLDTLRTGTKTQEVEEALIKANLPVLLLGYLAFSNKPSDQKRRIWRQVYNTLLQIAEKYSLSNQEFEKYCTITTPNGDGPVFYPYHVLSRPQAQALGWDWNFLESKTMDMLRVMRYYCNIHAEQAGYGEPLVDSVILIYWLGHHFCDKIRTVKKERP